MNSFSNYREQEQNQEIDLDISFKSIDDSLEIIATLPHCKCYAEISFDLEFIAPQAASVVSCRSQIDRNSTREVPLVKYSHEVTCFF